MFLEFFEFRKHDSVLGELIVGSARAGLVKTGLGHGKQEDRLALKGLAGGICGSLAFSPSKAFSACRADPAGGRVAPLQRRTS